MLGNVLDYQLTSCLRYDPEALLPAKWNTSRNGDKRSPYLLLSYAVDRLTTAANAHSWTTPSNLTLHSLESRCDAALEGKDPGQPYKIRVLLSKLGKISIESVPIPNYSKGGDLFLVATLNPTSVPSSELPISVYLDTGPTSASVFTSTKTTRREVYDLARVRAGVPAVGIETGTPKDVILYRSDGQVMESSIRNIAFWREGRWVTPPVQVGCLPGVARRLLIEEGKIVEGGVSIKDLKAGEILLLFNAVEGARLGRLCTPN